MRKSLLVIVALLVVLFVSCDQDPECNQSTISGVKFTLSKNINYYQTTLTDSIFTDGVFDSIYTRDTIKQVERPVAPVWIHSAGSETDTVFSTSFAENLQILPLTTGLSSTSFVMKYGDEEDEIIFSYTDDLQFLDIACGFISSFTLDSAKFSNTFIDSIILYSPIADNDVSTENIKIYYH